MFDNALKWTYTQLRGLHTNKNTFHLDRNGFLEYYNVENLKNFSRLRRGGACKISNQLPISVGSSYYPNVAKDFNYVDNVNNIHKRVLCIAAPKAFYILDGNNLSEITLPSMSGTIDNLFKWTMIPFKNRLLICTGIHNSYRNTNTITIDSTGKQFSGFATLPSDVKPGDVLVVNGINMTIKSRDSADALTIEGQYTASPSTGISNWRIIKNRVANFLIYDPTDTRNKDRSNYSRFIYQCGALPPPTQVVYDTTIYYDQSSTNAWIYRGKPGATSYITAKTGSREIILTNVDNMTAKIEGGDYIYIDDVEYEIDTITYTTNSGGTLTINLKDSKGFQELTINNYGILTSNNYKGSGTDHWWAIYYGELENIAGAYKYGYAYYNSKSGHISNLSPLAEIKNPYRKFNICITSWNNLADNDPNHSDEYDTIIFFRTIDGGVLLYETGRISSKVIPSGYSNYFYDSKTDTEIGPAIGEIYYNSPPPEFLAIEEWNGRIWGISALERDKLYYSMDEIQLASRSNMGRAEECYPATNYLVVPAEDGKITGIKRAGDFLYVATDLNLYVVTGYDETTFNLEKIFSGHGIKQEAMCEYSGILSRRSGLFFISNNYQAFIITPDIIKNVGESIEDLLKEASYNGSEVSVYKINTALRNEFLIYGSNLYESIKPRNYIIVSFLSSSGTRKNYAYDVEFDEWYELDFRYGSGINETFCPVFATTNIYGFPLAVGMYIDYVSGYKLTPLAIFNDYYYMDDDKSYSAYIRTSWLDFDNRELIKTLAMGKIFTPTISSNWTTSLYIDEEASAKTLKSYTYTLQETPYQEGKEYSLVYLDNNASQIMGHLFSIKINYPNGAKQEQIYNLAFYFQRIGINANER